MEQKKKKLLIIISILCIVVIISSAWLIYYSKPFNRISTGMVESEVREIMGEPLYTSNLTARQTFGPGPDIPEGTPFLLMFYSTDDTYQTIHLISPEDYSSITGKTIDSDEWVVIDKIETDNDIVY